LAAVTATLSLTLTVSPAVASPVALRVSVTVLSDGSAPFADWRPGDTNVPSGPGTAASNRDPGDDFGPLDGVVRTLDTSVFDIQYAVDERPPPTPPFTSGDVLLEVEVKGPARVQDGWSAIACTGTNEPDFNANRTRFTCHLGVFSGPVTKNFSLPVVAPMSARNGDTFSVTAKLKESANPTGDAPSATDTSNDIEVSAAPRFELVKSAVFNTVEQSPAGCSGALDPGCPGTGNGQVWIIGVRGFADDARGLSQLVPTTIMLSDLVDSSNGVPVWLLRCSAGSVPGLPDVVSVVTDPSRQLALPSAGCAQPGGPSSPIDLTIGNIDWDRASTPPILDRDGNLLAADHRGLIAYVSLTTWASHTAIDLTDGVQDSQGQTVVGNSVETDRHGKCGSQGGPWDSTGVQATWRPVDRSGISNLIGQQEPVANNGACLQSQLSRQTQTAKNRAWPPVNGEGVRSNDITQTRLSFANTGNVVYPPGGTVCDKWDNSRFGPSDAGFLTNNDHSSYSGRLLIEYGTGAWGASTADSDSAEWARQASSGCGDVDTLEPTTLVPTPGRWLSASGVDFGAGGVGVPVDAFNMVRITNLDPIPIGQALSFSPTWALRPGVPHGEEFRNYAAVREQGSQSWYTSTCASADSPSGCAPGLRRGQSAGGLSAWWTTVGGSVEVVKDLVGPGRYDAGDTLSAWRIRAGARPTATANPSVTTPATGTTSDVVLRDILPARLSYVPGSLRPAAGFPDPGPPAIAVDPVTGESTLSWRVSDLLGPLSWVPGGTYNLDFQFDVAIDVFAETKTYRNTVRAATPDDPTPYGSVADDARVADAPVEVVGASGAVIDKSVSPTALGAGDIATFTLRYANPSSVAIDTMDAIDILPFDGDIRGSHFGSGSFTFAGGTASAKVPAEVAWVSSVPGSTLDGLDGTDGTLDPSDPSVGAVGDPTQWPCRLADVGNALACPAIPSLAQVTAVRFVGTGPGFLAAGTGPFSITLRFMLGDGAAVGDKFVNSWLARFSGLEFPIRFTAASAGVTRAAVVPPAPSAPPGSPVPTVHPGGAGGGAGALVRTGADLGRLAVQAWLAVALGSLALAITGRQRRRSRRLAFSHWVENAPIDDLLRFAVNLSNKGRG
jgi:hypothetical protein